MGATALWTAAHNRTSLPINDQSFFNDIMGLPLVTLSGRSFASRMAASLLSALGASQGIATNLQEYIDFAALLAADKLAFGNNRRIFSAQSWRRKIGDIENFTISYEDSLLSIATHGQA
jgi:predicted O-linked N-acetylglucosamine transferase (SPINDLY family)